MYFLAIYWLSFEMVHCGEIFKNHTFRKLHLHKDLLIAEGRPRKKPLSKMDEIPPAAF